jgi:hypothetical protein
MTILAKDVLRFGKKLGLKRNGQTMSAYTDQVLTEIRSKMKDGTLDPEMVKVAKEHKDFKDSTDDKRFKRNKTKRKYILYREDCPVPWEEPDDIEPKGEFERYQKMIQTLEDLREIVGIEESRNLLSLTSILEEKIREMKE